MDAVNAMNWDKQWVNAKEVSTDILLALVQTVWDAMLPFLVTLAFGAFNREFFLPLAVLCVTVVVTRGVKMFLNKSNALDEIQLQIDKTRDKYPQAHLVSIVALFCLSLYSSKISALFAIPVGFVSGIIFESDRIKELQKQLEQQ